MRYRPFDAHGQSVSAVSLSLKPGAAAAEQYRLVCAALEQGINGFLLSAGDEGAAEAMRQAVAVVGRRVLIVTLKLNLDGPPFERQTRAALQTTGATYFDAILLDRPPADALSSAEFAELEAIRASRRAARLALASEAADAPAYLRAVEFDMLALRYNLASGWPERNLLKQVAGRGMSVIGYGYELAAEDPGAPEAPAKGLAKFLRRAAPAIPRAYDFLGQTPGWTAGQISLAYALCEPALASVLLETGDVAELEALSRAVEHELPAGVAAQIEIARFAAAARHSVAS